jgi:hypothetical protein
MPSGFDEDDWTAIDFLLFFDETEEERRARLARAATRPRRAAGEPPSMPPDAPDDAPDPRGRGGFRPPPPPDAPSS